MKYFDGRFYEGNWLNDNYDGKGLFKNKKGEVYEGNLSG